MKKFLTGIIACLLAVVGVFTLFGCEKERDFNGVYRLDYAFYGLDSNIVEYQYDLADTEVYIVIENTTITEYTFVKDNSSSKKLLNMQVMDNLTLPEFVVTKEDGVEYFTNFTDLGRYYEGFNKYKIDRWSYVKQANLPVILQNALVPYFGKYKVETSAGSNLVVSNLNNCSLLLNGNLTITDGDVETVYKFLSVSGKIHTFENNGKFIRVEVTNNKLTVSWESASVNASTDYIIWKLDTPIEEL